MRPPGAAESLAARTAEKGVPPWRYWLIGNEALFVYLVVTLLLVLDCLYHLIYPKYLGIPLIFSEGRLVLAVDFGEATDAKYFHAQILFKFIIGDWPDDQVGADEELG